MKGGENTPLVGESDFSGTTPRLPSNLSTPNILLPSQIVGATPFRTPNIIENGTPNVLMGGGSNTPGPMRVGEQNGPVLMNTPLRNRLNINSSIDENNIDALDHQDGAAAGFYDITAVKTNLRKSLANLPTPKNNFEIFIPDENAVNGNDDDESAIGGVLRNMPGGGGGDSTNQPPQQEANMTDLQKVCHIVNDFV
ncbi:unnamed protein product [Trichobilharzia regenti]|nr:unnamed protein product [Trichobilharzia regenti]